MAKSKSKASPKKSTQKISPEEAVRFLDDMRKMSGEMDEPTVAISLRVPGNILRSYKVKAKADGKNISQLLLKFFAKGFKRNKSPSPTNCIRST